MERSRGTELCLLVVLLFAVLPAPDADAQAVDGSGGSPAGYLCRLPGTLLRDIAGLPSDALSPAGRPLLGIGVAFAISGPLYLDEAFREIARPRDGGKAVPLVRDYIVRPFDLDNKDLVLGLHAGPLAVVGVGWLSGKREVAEWGEALLETVLLVDAVVLPVKVATGRRRPDEGDGALDFSPPGSVYDAFPSGHAAWTVGIASMVSRSRAPRWVKTLLWVTGAAVSLQRIASDAHWTSDVIVGGIVGIWAGRRVAERHWGDETGTP